MRFFIAGIMQGSHLGEVLHHQGYRERLKQLLADHFPDADIYDPLADHQDSLEYDEQRGREVFLRHNRLCSEVEVVVAFVTLEEGASATGDELRSFCRDHLAGFKVPRRIHIRPDLPLGPTGKILKRELKSLLVA